MKKLKPKETKPIALIFTAVSGVALGALLGVYVLLTDQPTRLSQEPDPERLEEPGNYTAYFVPGRAAEAETPNLRTALGRLERRAPGTVAFSEAELNYLLKQYRSEEGAEEQPAEEGAATMDQLNVRLVEEGMVLSGRVVVGSAANRFEMLVQAHVGFINTEEGPQLEVHRMTFNSLPVPAMAGMARSLVESKLQPESLPENWVKMWQNIRELRVESGQLVAEVGVRRA